MDTADIQKQIDAFLKTINVPGFIVFGIANQPDKVDVIYSVNNMPTPLLIKGLSGALNDLIQKI